MTPAAPPSEQIRVAERASAAPEADDRAASAGGFPRRGTVPVSVVILTLNEDVNIADCIASCGWSDDVHVLDSGSTDATAAVAARLGASVHVNPFRSFGEQRNWAIDNIPMRHDWIFHLDADERFTPELVAAMRSLIAGDPPEAGFHVPQKLMFMGRWLRHAGASTQMRLFHRRRMRFCDYGHGQRELTEGTVGELRAPYLHFAFSKGLFDWFEKHNRYSSLEALQAVNRGTHIRFRELFASDRVKRWRAWKDFGYRLPFRAQLRWLYMLFVTGGILDGRAGFTYASLIATYETMTSLKLRLLRAQRAGSHADFERDTVPRAQQMLSAATLSGEEALARKGDRHRQLVAAPPEPVSNGRASGELTAPARGPTGAAAAGPAGTNGAVAHQADILQMRPEASPWTFREKVGRAIWMLIGRPIFRISFHNWYPFRAWLLRRFGAKVGKGVALRPTVSIEVPWMCEIDDDATVGDHAILYSLGTIRIGKRAIISQYAHLCAGTHDYTDHTFKLIRAPIIVEDDVWIGADAFVGPGVRVGRLSVLGARSSTYKDLPPQQVCVGNPAKPIKRRELR
ncbi:MAG TPA: WcaF family extracellular polysaccharide biosynthesis acetyltransferase [Phycisphaerales bacterium]|nr:WcaF family extracellular polysaccharide biosynthesis acetyltransferase [Phycisphaerales bacterium]HMP38248.1 WcaF family extracellular polysaccharide biosynthesis acetyltransferase [Phycisphaerales bacterium]